MKKPEIKLPKIKWAFKPFPLPPLPLPKGFKIPKLPFMPKAAKKSLLVLEVGDDWLKIACVSVEGTQRKILHAISESIHDLPDLEISQKITQLLAARVFKPTEVLISYPAQHLTTRILSLPSVDPAEIKDIVELQAVKQTPYAREEITTGFQILSSDPSGYSRIFLAISHRDRASRYFRIVELAQIAVIRLNMTPSVDGLWAWSQMAGGAEAKDPARITLILDLDWGSTDLMIAAGGKFAFTRSLGLGARQLKEQGQLMEGEFLREVHRSVESGNAELKGEKITNIVLTGVAEPAKNLVALLAREFNLPCEISPVFGEAFKASVAGATLSEFQSSMASVAGFALDSQATKINLVPPDVQLRKNLEERGRDLAFMGTLCLALVMMLSVITFEKIYKRSSYLGKLSKEYDSIRPQAEEVERLVGKMKIAREQMEAEGGFLDVLHDINEILPDNMTLTSLQYNSREKNVVVRGISTEMSAVFQFLSTLEATPQLEFVKTRNVSKRKVEERELAEFEIVAGISGGAPTDFLTGASVVSPDTIPVSSSMAEGAPPS